MTQNNENSNATQPKLWGGRFSEPTDAFVEAFTASVQFDKRLAHYDIQGSLAHAKMLFEVGVLTESEFDSIHSGLLTVKDEISADRFHWRIDREDVHMNIEARLTELVGDVGKKLHTGRSRNDQVATDLRLYLREEIDVIVSMIDRLIAALVEKANEHHATVMPGFTHLQVAQPVTFGHHLLAWVEMIERDRQRLIDCRHRVNQCPLGSAALAGTTFPIDRQLTAKLLGFEGICQNSLDAVSDRDFVMEFCTSASMMMVHFSRIAEELVLWSSSRYSFIDLPDRFCTGSSIMPQKKNPDVPELIRGKAGRVVGHAMSLLMLMKSQPLAYNKDNQEDKEPLFDAIDTVKGCLTAWIGMMPSIKANEKAMRLAASEGYSTATDLADYLVAKGLPFRDAHDVVGKVVGYCVEKGIDLTDLTLSELERYHPSIEEDVFKVLELEGSLEARAHLGATAPKQVLAQVLRWQKELKLRGLSL